MAQVGLADASAEPGGGVVRSVAGLPYHGVLAMVKAAAQVPLHWILEFSGRTYFSRKDLF